MFARHGLSTKGSSQAQLFQNGGPHRCGGYAGRPRTATGFGAREAGISSRIHWDRPDSVLLSGEPELRLFVQSAALATLDQNASTLSVKMGDRPRAFSPGLLRSDRMPLRIKIPKELWDQSPWNFSIDTNLRTVPQKHCQSSDESTLWLTLGTKRSLCGHSKRIYPGTLTAVAELSKTEPVQIVFSKTLTWPAVAALAAVLASSTIMRPGRLSNPKQSAPCCASFRKLVHYPIHHRWLCLRYMGSALDRSSRLLFFTTSASARESLLDIPNIHPASAALHKGELQDSLSARLQPCARPRQPGSCVASVWTSAVVAKSLAQARQSIGWYCRRKPRDPSTHRPILFPHLGSAGFPQKPWTRSGCWGVSV